MTEEQFDKANHLKSMINSLSALLAAKFENGRFFFGTGGQFGSLRYEVPKELNEIFNDVAMKFLDKCKKEFESL